MSASPSGIPRSNYLEHYHMILRVAYKKPDDTALLHHAVVVNSDSSEEVVRKLQAEARNYILPKLWLPWMYEILVGTAVVEYIDALEESHPIPIPISLRQHELNPTLTAAFRHPIILHAFSNLVENHLNWVVSRSSHEQTMPPAALNSDPVGTPSSGYVSTGDKTEPREAIVLSIRVNKSALMLIILGFILVSAGGGTMAGTLAGSPTTGFQTGAAILTVLGLAQTLWLAFDDR